MYSSPYSFAVILFSNLPRKRIFAKEHSFAVFYAKVPRKNILSQFFSAKEYFFMVFPRKNIVSRIFSERIFFRGKNHDRERGFPWKKKLRKNRVDCNMTMEREFGQLSNFVNVLICVNEIWQTLANEPITGIGKFKVIWKLP